MLGGMAQLSPSEPTDGELRSDDGCLRIQRCGTRLLSVELQGHIGLAHVHLLTDFATACIDVAQVNLSLFLDLSRVVSIEAAGQAHLASFTRERALYFDRLHLLVQDAGLSQLVRAMFTGLPIRAYLHQERASFDAARLRAD
jgi:hypothetical protein